MEGAPSKGVLDLFNGVTTPVDSNEVVHVYQYHRDDLLTFTLNEKHRVKAVVPRLPSGYFLRSTVFKPDVMDSANVGWTFSPR